MLHAERLEDAAREAVAQGFTADLLDDAAEQNITRVAVRPFGARLEVEFAAGVLAEEFIGIDSLSQTTIEEIERVVVGITRCVIHQVQ